MRARLPGVPEAVALRVCDAVARLRGEELYKLPGVGETITWARALLALGPDEPLDETLGVALKVREDIDRVRARGSAAGCLSACRRVRPSRSCAAVMRAARRATSGVGDLLAAHRALAAVDAAQREEAFYALRAALCASHADLAVFAEAFALAFAAPDERARGPARAARRRSSAPRCRGSGSRPRRRAQAEVEHRARARRVERGGAAARARLRALHRRRARGRAAAAGAARAARAAARLAPHGADAPAPRGPRPARHDPRSRCATAASSSSAATARRRGGRAGSCSCAMFPARWRPTRGCC